MDRRRAIALAPVSALALAGTLALEACRQPEQRRGPGAEGVAAVQTRLRESTLATPSADPGESAPGLGTSEPRR